MNRIERLGVSLGLLSCMLGGATVAACTKQQTTQAVGVTTVALSDTQKACVITEQALSTIPLLAADVPYIELACGIAEGAEQLVLEVLTVAQGEKAKYMARVIVSRKGYEMVPPGKIKVVE